MNELAKISRDFAGFLALLAVLSVKRVIIHTRKCIILRKFDILNQIKVKSK